MTNEQKIEKFNQIQEWLWSAALDGNLMQSTVSAAMIRQFEIPSPSGEDPESA